MGQWLDRILKLVGFWRTHQGDINKFLDTMQELIDLIKGMQSGTMTLPLHASPPQQLEDKLQAAEAEAQAYGYKP